MPGRLMCFDHEPTEPGTGLDADAGVGDNPEGDEGEADPV